jgi:hypothetical protein
MKNVVSVHEFVMLNSMKAFFATAIMLASAISIWAQGQIVEGCCVLTAASNVTITDSLLDSSDVATINLVDVNFESAVNLSSDTRVIGDNDFSTAITSVYDPLGAEMIGLSRPTPGISIYPIFPSSPDFIVQPDQAGVIQAVPEPSTVALVSFAFGLIALARLKKHLFV